MGTLVLSKVWKYSLKWQIESNPFSNCSFIGILVWIKVCKYIVKWQIERSLLKLLLYGHTGLELGVNIHCEMANWT